MRFLICGKEQEYEKEKASKLIYDKIKALRESVCERREFQTGRAPLAVKAYARSILTRWGIWSADYIKNELTSMTEGRFMAAKSSYVAPKRHVG